MLILNMNHLITRIHPYFSSTILKRGWEYFQDCAVERLDMEGGTVIQATVRGTRKYRVYMDLTSFPDSSCSCPYEGYCKHMAAVLFEALDEVGLSAYDFLANRAGQEEIAAAASQVAADARALPSSAVGGKAKKSPTKPRIAAPQESGPVEEWHLYFSEKFGNPRQYGPYSIGSFYLNVRNHLFPLCQNWSPGIQRLYQLHVWLFVMQQIDRIYSQVSGYSLYYDNDSYFKNQSSQWIDDLVEIVEGIDPVEASQRYPQYLAATTRFLAENAFPARETLTDWSFVYRFLWGRLLNYKPWIIGECDRLRSELKKPDLSLVRKDALIIALVHFDILDGRDRQAMEKAEKELSAQDPAVLWGYFQYFVSSSQWDRLIDWLKWLKPIVKRSGQRHLSHYFHFWQEAKKHRATEEEWVATAIYLLPTSYGHYAKYLIEQGRYREWVDLNLFCGLSLYEVDPVDLKKVESKQKESVLPLYHQAVERCILEKNRDSYREAVRLMKKLEQLYRHLREQPRWARYIEYVSAKYSRYRAFQEELRKGKVVG
ncbi:SWIM zinc finger family protein [Effusibacillus lacus]|uniref:SWIM-type domain-containing protein n=1 Tax=Effusibacillus lacus TaxID=1348429 RepID=A0A292YFM6_9BACL|nr:SWIM zinc finger family protein [Effusibacillus lacus]TCS75448.1 SWIM zinc finger protein [Effusibacillus lacus]GAX88917.1 hypothetical protein EFBL_0531 [Effusibacillus lacus]